MRLEQARLVSCLLYGTLFLIVKCTSGGLHLKMFVFYIHLWNFGKKIQSFQLLLVVSTWRMTIFTLFSFAVLVANLRSKTKIHGLDRFHGNGPYCQSLTEKEPIRAGIYLRLALPYNKESYTFRLYCRTTSRPCDSSSVSLSGHRTTGPRTITLHERITSGRSKMGDMLKHASAQ